MAPELLTATAPMPTGLIGTTTMQESLAEKFARQNRELVEKRNVAENMIIYTPESHKSEVGNSAPNSCTVDTINSNVSAQREIPAASDLQSIPPVDITGGAAPLDVEPNEWVLDDTPTAVVETSTLPASALAVRRCLDESKSFISRCEIPPTAPAAAAPTVPSQGVELQ